MKGNKKNRAEAHKEWVKEAEKHHEEGQYLIIPCKIWKSDLFRRLSPLAQIIYAEFRNLAAFNNRKGLPFTYEDAQNLFHCGHKAFKSAIEELIDNGFIKLSHQGGLYDNPSLFDLSDKWYENDLSYREDPLKYLAEHFPATLKRMTNMKKQNAIRLERNRAKKNQDTHGKDSIAVIPITHRLKKSLRKSQNQRCPNVLNR